MGFLPSMHLGQSFLVAYLTPEMRMAHPLPWHVEQKFESYTYTEHLVVLAQHAKEPAMVNLIESLEQQIGS